MKALVLTDYNQMEIQDVALPEPGPAEVLVAVKACGICGSDVHGMDGSTGRRQPPIIMGHEAAGTVAKLGPGVAGLAVGDRITFDSTVYCGDCRFCRQGLVNLCDRRQVLGVACDEFRRQGAFAEYVAVPQRIVVPLPDAVSFEQAALVEPVSVAVHAVGRLPLRLGDTAVVIGSGMIGLLVIQALRAAGCARIMAVDVDPARLELATQLGATETLLPENAQAVAGILRATGGGADLAVEAAGLPATVDAAIHSVRKGGAVALVGNVTPHTELPLQAVVTRELTLLGCCASQGEYPACLDLIARGTINVAPLLSAVAPLAEGPAWFERLRNREQGLMKVVLRP